MRGESFQCHDFTSTIDGLFSITMDSRKGAARQYEVSFPDKIGTM